MTKYIPIVQASVDAVVDKIRDSIFSSDLQLQDFLKELENQEVKVEAGESK